MQNYNVIENLGTLTVNPVYVVEYYYMKDDGTYPAEPTSKDETRKASRFCPTGPCVLQNKVSWLFSFCLCRSYAVSCSPFTFVIIL